MPFPRRKPLSNAPPLTPDEVLLKAEHYCAYRERSPKEVRQKLAELGLRGDEADQLYGVLQEDGFFNEERFAVAFAGGKFRSNHWGRVRIRMELKMTHGISPDVIQQALDGIPDEDYRATLQHLLEKKLHQLAGDDNARQKAAAYAIRTGFEPELVFAYL